ncbi:hypothetical protein ETB97_012929 [Aspergillus alliaceus]|uniref:Uncharacterized protein n=1 Tax=Petromyces alliaceus TaxID=209559 RepID=A0A8H6E811_PETAA|nr:hypothetical protein ETB97_012929 [Aspergillus burnettii]
MGVLSRGVTASGVEEEAWTSNGKIWRHNLSAFIARLSAWGICDPELSGSALSIFRDTFETRRPLTATNDQQGDDILPIADLLPAAVVWFELCAYQIENLCLSTQKCESSTIGDLAREVQVVPDTGFSTSRWLFWRLRLKEISHSDHAELEVLAQRGLRVMQFWGIHIEAQWTLVLANNALLPGVIIQHEAATKMNAPRLGLTDPSGGEKEVFTGFERSIRPGKA